MKQTVNEAVECHRKLWHGIAEEIRKNGFQCDGPGQLKKVIMKRLFPILAEDEVRNNCFLCEFTSCDGKRSLNCGLCPLVAAKPTACLNGMYTKFISAYLEHNKKKAIQYAEQIAELPIINPKYKEETGEI